jgi:hypothetical protein
MILLASTIVMLGGYTWLAAQFLYLETCVRAGGHLEPSGVCIGARRSIASLWDAPWQGIALVVIPPSFAAIAILLLAWRAWPKGEKK